MEQVRIASADVNTYSTIIRCCLTGINSCAKVNNTLNMQLFQKIKDWAEVQHTLEIDKIICQQE